MANFDFDLLNEQINNAPTAGFGPSVTFGKCLLKVQVISWDRSSGSPVIVEKDWDGASKLKDGENFRMVFTINVKEFNPSLEKDWVRKIDVKKSGRKSDGTKNPKALTDWEETVLPSLLKVIGPDYAKKLLGKGVYVEVQEIDTVVLDKNGNPKSWVQKAVNEGQEDRVRVNTAPKFVRSFKSKEECQAAREERFGKKDEEQHEEEEEEQGNKVPKKAINEFKALVSSLNDDVSQAIELVDANNLYPGFKGVAVALAAGFTPPF